MSFDLNNYKDKLKQFGAGIKEGLGQISTAFNNARAAEAANDPTKMERPTWQDPGKSQDMQSVYDQIMNRKDFQFDLNGNALYQQLRNTYDKQGQLGAMNAIGAASAMTGGYGNTYAAAAGQQAYQQSLENLNQQIPDLYAMALQQYQMQGDQLAQKYAVASDDRAFQYGVYRDQVSDWENDRDFRYQAGRDEVADKQWQQTFDENRRQYEDTMSFQQQRARAQDEQWQKQFDYTQFIDNRDFEYQKTRDAEDDRRWQAEYDLDYDKYLTENSHWNITRLDNLAQLAIENEHWNKTFNQTERFHEDDKDLSYAELAQQDKFHGEEMDYKYAGLKQEDTHFNATMAQQDRFHQDEMGLNYASLAQNNTQFYASLNQDDKHFWASLSQEDKHFLASLSQEEKELVFKYVSAGLKPG